MNLKRRTDRLIREAQARRETAWDPVFQVTIEALGGDVHLILAECKHWLHLPQEEREAANEQLPLWGEEALHAAWRRWAEAWDRIVEEEGVGEEGQSVWPWQLPAPPEEPPDLWNEMLRLVQAGGEGHCSLARCAAAAALMELALARGLRASRN